MKQGKHFKRTAFPLSAKSMVSLMLLLIAMLMPQGVRAEQFISDIMVSTNDKSDPAKNALTNNGYTIVTGDINNGTGGNWAYLGVKYTTKLSEAITGIMVCKGNAERADKLQEGGGAYVIIEGDSRKWYRAKASGDCNIDNKGVGLTVFYTRDGATTGTPLVTSLNESNSTEITGVTYAKYWEGTSNDGTIFKGTIQSDYADCNKGAGSKTPYIYLYYTTHTHALTDGDYDTNTHKVWCASCGYVSKYNAHVWESTGEEMTPASCTKLSVHYQTCKYCKRTGDSAHTYTTGTYAHDLSLTGSLKEAGKCYAWPVYYKKCSKCGKEVEETVLGDTKPKHTYDSNGFCTVCQSGTEPPQSGGYYMLSRPCHLVWFRDVTNGVKAWIQKNDANVKLANSIDMNGIMWDSSIGDAAGGYMGTFDGGYNTIRNLNTGFVHSFGSGCACMFNTIGSGGTVKNLEVENYRPFHLVANTGLVRTNQGTLLHVGMHDCYLQFHAAHNNRGGLCGVNEKDIKYCRVVNTTLRNRRGNSYYCVGGLVGVNNGLIQGSYTYNLTYTDMSSYHGIIDPSKTHQGTISNCAYSNDNSSEISNSGKKFSAERFASGEVACYLDNCGKDVWTSNWYQDLKVDALPYFVPNGKTVKKTDYIDCEVHRACGDIYINPGGNTIRHTYSTTRCERPYRNAMGYDWRICQYCGNEEILKTYNYCGDFNGDKVFTISDLTKLIEGVNNSETSLEYDINYDNKVDAQDVQFGAEILTGAKTYKIEYGPVWYFEYMLLVDSRLHLNDKDNVFPGYVTFYPQDAIKNGFDIAVVRTHSNMKVTPVVYQTGENTFAIKIIRGCDGKYTIRITAKDGSGTFVEFDIDCHVL